MKFNKKALACGLLFSMGVVLLSFADDQGGVKHQMKHPAMMEHMDDGRISLNLPPHMKNHQLANMRSHLEAIQEIIADVSENKFDAASEIAHTKLGLTDEMQQMCSMFENDNFRKLGFAFHESADSLSDILKTKDLTRSLDALHTTMGYCVQCHATFRQ